MTEPYIDSTAIVEEHAFIGFGARIWNWTKVRNSASVGKNTSVGQCCYIDENVSIGKNCKIQNGVQIYNGVTIGDSVFVGPNVTFTNDKIPRAHNDGWKITETVVKDGVSIGAGAVIVCGVTLGAHCMIGAGAVVTKDVPDNALVTGNPAQVTGHVDKEGQKQSA